MTTRSTRALVLLHDLFWIVLISCPALLVPVWIGRLPEPPRRTTWERAYGPLLDTWGMLLLFGVVAVLLVFLAEYATGRVHRWARTGH